MAGMNVNVSLEKLEKIKEYIDEFQSNVMKECNKLENAANSLKRKNSADDIQSIITSVEEIQEIINGANPTFKELQDKIESYIRIINRLKAIAQG